MPLIGFLTNNYNFENLAIPLGGDNAITYGVFIEKVINFILIAFVLFIIIKFFNNLRRLKQEEEEEEEKEIEQTEIELLTEIRDLLKDREKDRE